MRITDIVTIPITPDMEAQAEADKQMLSRHVGISTRPASETRDLTGSLAHQAVEICMTDHDYEYQSTRKVLYEHGGDKYDIKFGEHLIDIKGRDNPLNDEYYFNEDMLVMSEELPSIATKGITHFVFVSIDYVKKLAYIYGAITADDFIAKATPRPSPPLPYPAHGVKSRDLTPFVTYINGWRQL